LVNNLDTSARRATQPYGRDPQVALGSVAAP
jgi:hypothetical protein